MVGFRKDPSADQCGQLSLHLDLEAFPRTFRVDDDAVHKRPEVGNQRAAVVVPVGNLIRLVREAESRKASVS
jgi:hypothetical protein